MKTATLGCILFALLADASALRAQLPVPFPPPPLIRPPTTPTAQRNALSVLRSQVDWFRNATRTAPGYATGGYDEVRRQFDLLRAAYDQFKATLTPNQLASGANELAELEAGLDILQEAFDEYQQDVAAGRSQAAAFRSLCRVLDEAAGLWLQELNKVAEKLRVGFP
ncbi:exported hypothetical protein [Verrucomicrobia bacterium]|nr:exported hypothetical protein [Verrucomicrobiota bacterium]